MKPIHGEPQDRICLANFANYLTLLQFGGLARIV